MQQSHSKICPGILYPIKEHDRGLGLVRHIEFKCSECSIDNIFRSTENPNKSRSEISYGAVWGTLATGSTFGHLEELLSVMNVPPINQRKFNEIEKNLGEIWQDQLSKDMETAALEEAEIAKEKGHIDSDGVPYITVYLDGGWSHRSYGHNYNASSGVGVIIGKETSKVLYLGIRNKYCIICARATNKKELPKQHKCFRNWSGSSSAMESDIIVEGFCFAEETYKIRFKYFIGDGDSSVYSKIVEQVPYGRMVKKMECANHAIKNYGKMLYSVCKDTKVNLNARKQLSNKVIKELQSVAQKAIYNCEGVIKTLTRDLKNGPLHVFGDHRLCEAYYCNTIGENDIAKIESIKKNGLYNRIYGALEMLLKKSYLLVSNENNNRSEIYMNILARFNAGKRLNLTSRGSFQTRCVLNGMRYNKGIKWHSSPWKCTLKRSPGKYFKKYISRYSNRANNKKCKRTLFPKTTILKLPPVKNNKDYGRKAQQPEPSEEIIDAECERVLEKLQVTKEEQTFIEANTKDQFASDLYRTERADRLTASVFGAIIKKRTATSCHNLVKQILYNSCITTPSIEFGKTMEAVAIKKFEQEKGVTVLKAGFFVDITEGFLGASPDGLVGTTHVVEVKCLHKIFKLNISLEEAVEKHNICLEKHNNTLRLKRNHIYWHQVQGQLNITQRKACYFVIYIGDDRPLFVEEIQVDKFLWDTEMKPILVQFYRDCVLQEVVRRRIPKGQKCYDPPYIIETQNKNNNKKKVPIVNK